MEQRNSTKARNLWSEEEDDVLRREVSRQEGSKQSQGESRDWRSVAAKIPGRSNKDCRKRWMKLDSSANKGSWSEDEDFRLRQAVQHHSTMWTEVSRAVATRNPDQCAKRWIHFLSPDLDHSEWTAEDDRKLLEEVEESGHNWRKIVDEALAGRSATDAKNRYTILQRSKRNGDGSEATVPRQRRRRMTAQSKSNGTAEVASGSREPSNLSSSHTTVPEGDVLRNESFGSDLVGLGDSLDGCLAQQPNSNFPFTTDFSSLHHNVAMNPTLDWPVLPPQTSGTGTPFTAMGVNMLDPHTDKILSGNSEQFASAMDFSYHGSHTPALAQPLVDSGQRSDPPGAISESSSQPWTRYGDEESDEDEDLEDEAMAVDSRGGEIEQPGSNTGDSNGKTSTVVISHAKPEMVRKVVDLLFSSNSTVDVKIFDQKSESEQKE